MLYPMFAMVVLALFIGCLAIKARFASVKSGKVSIKYYSIMEGAEVPEVVTRTTRCFNNQFEVPVFFYVAGTLYISLGMNDSLGVMLAWLFVLIRYFHAFIHLTYNNIIHRMAAFWLSFIIVFILWGSLVTHNL